MAKILGRKLKNKVRKAYFMLKQAKAQVKKAYKMAKTRSLKRELNPREVYEVYWLDQAGKGLDRAELCLEMVVKER